MSLLGRLLDSIAAMPGQFADVAMYDPNAAVMLLIGTVLLAVSFGVFGGLVLGAVVDLLTPESTGRSYR